MESPHFTQPQTAEINSEEFDEAYRIVGEAFDVDATVELLQECLSVFKPRARELCLAALAKQLLPKEFEAYGLRPDPEAVSVELNVKGTYLKHRRNDTPFPYYGHDTLHADITTAE